MDNIYITTIKNCLGKLNNYSGLVDKYYFAENYRTNQDLSIELEQRIYKNNELAKPFWVNKAIVLNEKDVEVVRLKMSERLVNDILSQGIILTKID